MKGYVHICMYITYFNQSKYYKGLRKHKKGLSEDEKGNCKVFTLLVLM